MAVLFAFTPLLVVSLVYWLATHRVFLVDLLFMLVASLLGPFLSRDELPAARVVRRRRKRIRNWIRISGSSWSAPAGSTVVMRS
jgi:hypothetical protein